MKKKDDQGRDILHEYPKVWPGKISAFDTTVSLDINSLRCLIAELQKALDSAESCNYDVEYGTMFDGTGMVAIRTSTRDQESVVRDVLIESRGGYVSPVKAIILRPGTYIDGTTIHASLMNDWVEQNGFPAKKWLASKNSKKEGE